MRTVSARHRGIGTKYHRMGIRFARKPAPLGDYAALCARLAASVVFVLLGFCASAGAAIAWSAFR